MEFRAERIDPGDRTVTGLHGPFRRCLHRLQRWPKAQEPGDAVQGHGAAVGEILKDILASFHDLPFQLQDALAHGVHIPLQSLTVLLQQGFQGAVLHLLYLLAHLPQFLQCSIKPPLHGRHLAGQFFKLPAARGVIPHQQDDQRLHLLIFVCKHVLGCLQRNWFRCQKFHICHL